MPDSAKFFIEIGLAGEEEKTIGEILRQLVLGLCSRFQGDPDYWLELDIIELVEWAMTANRMQEEENRRQELEARKARR